MNLQESIRKVLREETVLPLYIRRRVSMEELDGLVVYVKDLIDSNYDKTDAIYDTVRQFVATKKEFNHNTEQGYWDSEVEEPLVNYVKTNLQESIRRILREETNTLTMILRRVNSDDLEREFEESLDMASDNLFYRIRNGKGVIDLKSFIEVTTSILIDGIHSELYNTLPEDVQWYQDVQESLKEYYRDRIKVRYKKLMSKL